MKTILLSAFALFIFYSCQQTQNEDQTPTAVSTAEQPQSAEFDHSQKVRDFLAAMDANDSIKMFALCTNDFVVYHPNYQQPLQRVELMQHVRAINTALNNATHNPLDFSSDKNSVSARGTVSGKHTAAFMGLPPTGNDVKTDWISFSELDDEGKMKTLYVQFNQMAFMQQLGMKMPQ